VDILVNNAGGSEQRQAAGSRQQVYAVDPIDGRTLPPGRYEEMSDDEFLNAFRQKVLALGFTMKAVLPLMKAQKSGAIVNVVSMKGKQPPPRVVSSSVAAAAAMNCWRPWPSTSTPPRVTCGAPAAKRCSRTSSGQAWRRNCKPWRASIRCCHSTARGSSAPDATKRARARP